MFRKFFGAVGVGAVLALAPVAVDVETSDRGPVRLNGACGQATGCTVNPNALCSTHNGNERGYECLSGCGNNEA